MQVNCTEKINNFFNDIQDDYNDCEAAHKKGGCINLETFPEDELRRVNKIYIDFCQHHCVSPNCTSEATSYRNFGMYSSTGSMTCTGFDEKFGDSYFNCDGKTLENGAVRFDYHYKGSEKKEIYTKARSIHALVSTSDQMPLSTQFALGTAYEHVPTNHVLGAYAAASSGFLLTAVATCKMVKWAKQRTKEMVFDLIPFQSLAEITAPPTLADKNPSLLLAGAVAGCAAVVSGLMYTADLYNMEETYSSDWLYGRFI